MAVSSHDVVLGPITAFQRDAAVWVRRAGSGVAPSRCHLACHWLRISRQLAARPRPGRYLPAIQPLMAWSIALSTLLCYYPLELPISTLARVGELFGICRRDHSGRAVRPGRREGRCPVGGSTDSPSDWSGGSGHRITARRRG
jgi:hypothetical protein